MAVAESKIPTWGLFIKANEARVIDFSSDEFIRDSLEKVDKDRVIAFK